MPRAYRVQRRTRLIHRIGARGRSVVTDLEIGAVDELLVGVSVIRDKDKGENHPLGFSSALRLSTLL